MNQRTEARAEAILEAAGLSEPPIDLERLANIHGIAIVYEPFHDESDDVSGVLFRESASTVIGVNSRQARTRQRFTIAHELGHYFLHAGKFHLDRGSLVKFRDEVSALAVDRDEIGANAFAAALLMPRSAFTAERLTRAAQLSVSEDDLVSRLARVFDVSPQAMQYRLLHLGLIAG